MKFKGLIFACFTLFFSLFLLSSLAYAGIASEVKSVTFNKGKNIVNYRKHFSDGKNIRYEEETKSEGRIIEILNYDARKKYTVMDALMMYIVQEMPKEEEISPIINIIEGKDKDEIKPDKDIKKPANKDKKPPSRTVEKKLIKEELYEGFNCAVYEIKITITGRVNQITVWAAKELNNMILKSEDISYIGVKTSIEHKNIKQMNIEPSLFLPPEKYKSVSPF